MKIRNYIIGLGVMASTALSFPSCTDLSETVYDQVMSNNYYNTKQDVINAVFRPFEYLYCCIWMRHENEELPADQLITPTRGGSWWYDGGIWEMYHRHQYNDITLTNVNWSNEWGEFYIGIANCNFMLDELNRLDPASFDLTEEDFNNYKAQLRCLRCWAYLRLLNAYRNCILTTTSDQEVNMQPENRKQVAPQVLFDFIESELKDFCLEHLPSKTGQDGNSEMQGQFTKAAAASLLVRLYLNSEKWTGQEKWQECIDMAKRITSGEFGYYAIAENWYEPFDWNNETCNEVIFGFPGSYSTTSWHLNNQNKNRTIYGRALPYGCQFYLNIEEDGERNPRFALSPSYDNQRPRQLFTYQLGMPVQKFRKYDQYGHDKRLKQYKNLSNNTREGMFFLEGKIPSTAFPGGYAKNPQNQYELYLVDQVGLFNENAEQGYISNPAYQESKLGNGDFNSGLYCVKYPFYPFDGGYYIESDYTEIRLTEIIYSQAECLIRLGQADEAGRLLNSVRKRNYEDFNANVAYRPEGNVTLDMDEMLDEWGREFLAESRRRTDLIRFGKFQDAWWDKPQDADDHYEIYPLSQTQLEQNPYLKQNPGYPDIAR